LRVCVVCMCPGGFVFPAAVLLPGYDLLKKKSDALTFRFRDITKKIRDAKDEMGEVSRAAAFSLSEAVWAAGDFKYGKLRPPVPAPRFPRWLDELVCAPCLRLLLTGGA
jgi:hypothetical protein